MIFGKPLLQVEGLHMRFGGLTAVQDVSFDVWPQSVTALIGPNGAGKTTVFNCITGFYKPSGGSVSCYHSGQMFKLSALKSHEVAKRASVVRTFQNIRLFKGMTLLENLLVAQHNDLMSKSGWSVGGLLGLKSYRDAEIAAISKAKMWLELSGLGEKADHYAGDLAYGDQRRLEIARAMCTGPRLLCLDEPAAGLNTKESSQLADLLRVIKTEHLTSVLLIEHDMSVVMSVSDHVVVLEYGKKIAEGAPKQIQSHPEVIRAYLGEDEADESGDMLMALGSAEC